MGAIFLAGYDAADYGTKVGGDYDGLYPGVPDETAAAVRKIAELAIEHAPAGVLEFGIGTGRLAFGVDRRGIRVVGIDGSEEMIEQLRSKPDNGAVETVVGDYRDTTLGERFGVVVLAFNGIMDPRGIRAQLDIFANAAGHLIPAGYFIVESWVMNDAQRRGDWSIVPRFVGNEHVELQLARYDLATNGIDRTLVHLLPDGIKFLTVADVYTSPEALDVMAEVSGFDRVSRHATWGGAPFTATSANHITVYQLRTN